MDLKTSLVPVKGESLPSDVLKALLQGREDLPPVAGGSQVLFPQRKLECNNDVISVFRFWDE